MAYNIFYVDRESSARTNFEDLDQFLDYKLGYGMGNGFYFGAIYSTFSDNDEKRTAVGPSIGYFNSGFFVGASYLLELNHRIETEFQTLSGGSGTLFEVSYNYAFTSYFSLGLNVTYLNLSFDKTTSFIGGEADVKDHSESYILPMLQLSFSYGGGDSVSSSGSLDAT